MNARAARVGLLIAFLCRTALALGPDRTIAQFHHTAWTAKDGAPSQITALAQTTDGFLWIGTARGLFRFDGVHFERYTPPPGVTVPSENIYTVAATPDGGLWISFRSRGLGFLKDGRLTVFSRADEIPQSWVYFFAFDHDGRVWAGTYEGLALKQGTRWLEVGPEWNLERGRVWSMLVDRDGTLWVGVGNNLRFLRRGATRFEDSGVSTEVKRLVQSNDGTLWIGEHYGHVVPLHGASTVGLGWSPSDMLVDRDNTLWITAEPDGLKRLRVPARAAQALIGKDDAVLDSFRERDGLSGDVAQVLFEDREGTIWVGTSKGLDRFRYSHIAAVPLPPQHDQLTLVAGDHGDVWAGSASNLALIHIDQNEAIARPSPLTSCVYRDPSGDVWWGGNGAIWRQRGAHFDVFPQPRDLIRDEPSAWMWEIVGGDDRDLWIRAGNVGLVHFKDGVWSQPPPPAGLLPHGPSATYCDSPARTWFGYSTGRVDLLDHGRVTTFMPGRGLEIGRIKVIRRRGQDVWFGGESGLAVFHNGTFRNVLTGTGERFGTIAAIIAAADGTLWLSELRGIIRIPPDEVQKVIADATHRAAYQLLDFQDGLPGAPQMNFTVSAAVEASDGRLWFATDNGLARIDPAHLQTNHVAPPVSIVAIVADREYAPAANLRFPIGTQKLQVRYTALSLAIPERVQFRYKLEGVDEQWQDAGSRREAFYTNLRPGKYTFRVKAANNDGVWNEAGSALAFEVPPAFFQTRWFLILMIALAATLFWAAYQLRLRRLAARLQRLHEERMDERLRIARELHDTLLQGFLSASMRLQLAAEQLPGGSPARATLDDVIKRVIDVSEEGRQAVQGLRVSEDAEPLEEAFSRTKAEIADHQEIGFRVVVDGRPRPLQPLIRDEIYRIGREALVNAFKHSAAQNIEVELEYLDRNLRLHVRDDGRGIDPVALQADGHWGLAGMKERAGQIGAKLRVSSRSGAGTEIELTIPAAAAYQKTI